MSNTANQESASTPSRGRGGRGRSRGGFGKYLRARGKRGVGPRAEFTEHLSLSGDKAEEVDEEEAAEIRARYSRRQLGTNADRYVEPEPELGSDGEPIVEPEVDLSTFLERQRISEVEGPSIVGSEPATQLEDEDDVDHTLSHITSDPKRKIAQKKGKVEHLEWDEELEFMAREKAASEATRDLKQRFLAKPDNLKSRPIPTAKDRKANNVIIAPALPTSDPPKDHKTEMQDFLDELLG